VPGSTEAGTGDQRLVIGVHHRSTPAGLARPVARLNDLLVASLRSRHLRPIFVIDTAIPADAALSTRELGGAEKRNA
jgi:hypothetical protein